MKTTEKKHHDFEDDLRRMRLAAPPEDLYRRRLRAAQEPRRVPFWSYRGWGFELVLATALVLCLGLAVRPRPVASANLAGDDADLRRVTRAVAEWGGERSAEYVREQLALSRRLAEIEATKQLLQPGGSTPWM